MTHKSATVQAAVSSGGKIGQKPPPGETKREAQNQQLIWNGQSRFKRGAVKRVGGKNTHVKAIESVERFIEIHLLFHTLHQLCANGERTTLKSQTEE